MSEDVHSAIEFYVNDQAVSLKNVAPTYTVLQLLRERLALRGTKEGCAEGDCGACTVIIGEQVNQQLRLKSVNACIQFVPTLHGKLLYTVEYLKQQNGKLHPVQQAMVDCHGSQCGFCTPGFVMSLWGYYVDKIGCGAAPNKAELKNVLSGNLCRCTGYKPILEAGVRMFDPPAVEFDKTQALQKLSTPAPNWQYTATGAEFFAPTDLKQLVNLRRAHPSSTILAGGTDVGLWVNKQFRALGPIIYTGHVAELLEINQTEESLIIGSAVSLTDAYQKVLDFYPQLEELMLRFASVPIRNAGTLGGNIANGSPIGDSAPWLIAIGAKIVLANVDGERTLELQDLYIDYMKQARAEDEVLAFIKIPKPAPNHLMRTWKVCKRYDSDISAVCGAFWIDRDNAGVIRDARVAFGGMAATSKRAPNCEQALIGQPWTEQTAKQAMHALQTDYQPLSDMRATAAYRQQVAGNLLYRFYLETSANPTATRAYTQLEA